MRSSNWVTLFFIPILPFYFGKGLKCNICGASGDLDATALQKLKQGESIAIGG